ncbi:hypothetical protein PG995_014237 [Apiospora arundinis]
MRLQSLYMEEGSLGSALAKTKLPKKTAVQRPSGSSGAKSDALPSGVQQSSSPLVPWLLAKVLIVSAIAPAKSGSELSTPFVAPQLSGLPDALISVNLAPANLLFWIND